MFSKKKILLTDEELVGKYATTLQNEYLAELYARYSTLAYGTCMKYLKNPDWAKDAAMDVFERLVTDLPKYNVVNFKSWLYIVIKNHCLQLLKNQQNNINLDDVFKLNSDEGMEKPNDFTLDDITSNEETLVAMEKALDQLEIAQKECVVLFYLEKKSYNEITEQTGYSFNEVKSHIQNGKRNLKIKLMKIIATVLLFFVFTYK